MIRIEKTEAVCALEFDGEPWKLLVMGRLSAQCTDARVNIVCRELFARFPTCESLARASYEEIEEIIRPCGLFRTKAKNIKDACAMLCDEYGGQLPDDMDELLKFPGVGRKIANLLLGDIFHKPTMLPLRSHPSSNDCCLSCRTSHSAAEYASIVVLVPNTPLAASSTTMHSSAFKPSSSCAFVKISG